MRNAFFFLPLFLAAAPAFAEIDCWNSDKTYYDCSHGGGGAVGASAPLIGDTLGSNPAALPTNPSPFGLEGTFHNRAAPSGHSKVTYSTVKGFDGIGFGIGAWSDGTFGAPDFPAHFLSSPDWIAYQAYEKNPPSVLGLRLGTSVLLPRVLFPKFIRFSLGGSIGLGRVQGQTSPQLGILARIYNLGIGYSENYEQLSTALPKTRISKFDVGLQLSILYLGYSYDTIRSSANRTFANIFSVRLQPGKWTLHGALKKQKDHRGAEDLWTRGGLQRRLGERFGVGYEYGIYRYSHSGVLQVFF